MNTIFILGLLTLCVTVILASGSTLIYKDDDIPHDIVDQLHSALERAGYPSYRIVSPVDLAQDNWQLETQLLIFPDGRGESYGHKLEAGTLKSIRKWVEGGGRLMGIGAGAYIASTSIDFSDSDQGNVVKGNGLLSLYPGTAYGPAVKPITRVWEKVPRATWVAPSGDKTRGLTAMYGIGSCYFKLEEAQDGGWRSLVDYVNVEGEPSAIIIGDVGKGKVLLSGPNWSIDHESMVGLEETAMYQDLQLTAPQRRDIAAIILAELLAEKKGDQPY